MAGGRKEGGWGYSVLLAGWVEGGSLRFPGHSAAAIIWWKKKNLCCFQFAKVMRI